MQGTVSTSAPSSAGSATLAGHPFDRANLPLLLTLALGVFAGAFDLGVLSPALPALGHAFAVTPRDLAWVFTLYLFANVVAIPVTTKLSDTIGRRPAYIASVGVFAAGSILAIFAPTFSVFLIARAVQAAGAGGIFPVAAAAIADRVPFERRGAALGLLGAVWGVAAILGPTAGGIVTHYLSWRWIFAANVPLALIVIARARTQLPSAAAHRRGPLDVAGIVTLSIALLGIMVGLTRIDANSAHFGTLAVPLGALAVSIAALAALHIIERRAAEPVISPALFGSRQLAVTYGLEVLIGVLEGALFFVPAALVAAEHLSIAAAGLVAAFAAVVFVAVIPLAGRALDAFGSRAVLSLGAACTAVGLAAFGLTLADLWLALPALMLAAIGFGALLGAPTRYIVTNEAPTAMRTTAIGLLSVFLIIGQIVGGSLAGGVIGGNIGAPGPYTSSYLVFAGIAVVTLFATQFLAPKRVAVVRQS